MSEEEIKAFYNEEENDRDDDEEYERYRESLQDESVFISSLKDSITKQKGKEGTSGGDAKEKKLKDAEFAFLQCMQANLVSDETEVGEDHKKDTNDEDEPEIPIEEDNIFVLKTIKQKQSDKCGKHKASFNELLR